MVPLNNYKYYFTKLVFLATQAFIECSYAPLIARRFEVGTPTYTSMTKNDVIAISHNHRDKTDVVKVGLTALLYAWE